MKKCPKCQTPHEKEGIFCSRKCANSRGPAKNETKKGPCSLCGKEIEIGLRGSFTQALCSSCYRQPCKICGQLECPRPDICRLHRLLPGLEKYFGFNTTTLGTLASLKEFERVRMLVTQEVANQSLNQLKIKVGHSNVGNLQKIVKALGVTRNSISSGVKKAILENRLDPGKNLQVFQAWHTTWNGKKAFLRSSYELEYAKQLDEKQIDYEVEALRILYWDSHLLCQRVAIPDFYLPATNTIVEIKADGSPWYDPQNMEDKKKAYLAHGYCFELKLW